MSQYDDDDGDNNASELWPESSPTAAAASSAGGSGGGDITTWSSCLQPQQQDMMILDCLSSGRPSLLDQGQTGLSQTLDSFIVPAPDGSNSRFFLCPYCQKLMNNKTHFRYHYYTHLSIKPFQCKLCDSCFNHRSNYMRHLKTVHMVSPKDLHSASS